MYESDLTKEQYEKIERYLQSDARNGGRPLKHSKYHILNAILYVLKTGCQSRQLPKDFPPWQTTYTQFKRWRIERTFSWMLRQRRLFNFFERFYQTVQEFIYLFNIKNILRRFSL